MKLLITPALQLTEEEKEELGQKNELFFIQDERIPIHKQNRSIDLSEIEGIVCNFFFLYNEIDIFPNLRFVQLTSVGLDRVPIEEMRKRKIRLFNAGDAYAVPMAEWIVGKILELYKYSAFFAGKRNARQWEKNRSIRELAGSIVAILGFGNVGRNTAKRLRPFGVTIRAVDIVKDKSCDCDEWYSMDNLKEAIVGSDIIILALPLAESTWHIIDEDIFAIMKQDAVLINTARGALVNEKALIHHLESGHLFGAALDVMEEEPLPVNSPIWDMDSVIVTPHNSFVGNGNKERLYKLLLRNLNLL